MALLIREMTGLYKYVFVEQGDPRVVDLPLMSSPLPVLAIVTCYCLFVTNYGPRWMSERNPFNLDRLIQVYNVIQIIIAVWLAERALTLCWLGKYNWFCEPINYSSDPETMKIVYCCYVYFLVKVLDLMDTVFFVMRKKNAQISFLHVYHHAGMVLATWCGIKFFAGGHTTFLGLLNSMVHAVMYSYYLVTSLYPQYKKKIWWKKHLTQMQMCQFLLIAVHQGQTLFQSDCDYPKLLPMFLVPQNAFLFWLFYDFYRTAYRTKKEDGVEVDRTKKEDVEEVDEKRE